MRKIAVIGIILGFTVLSAQPHGRRSWGGQQQQMKDAPKIGVVYGTVVDSASALPVPYASVYVISQRGGTIVSHHRNSLGAVYDCCRIYWLR